MNRGWSITGREMLGGGFRCLRFQDQVTSLVEDLTDHFWRKDARVVAVSFSAYFFLYAQAELSDAGR